MALVVAEAASLKPDINLSRALHNYEVVLSDEEKAQLRAQGVPNAMDVIKLTINLDKNSDQRRRRCMGQRLITFLESIQQFSTVVDTFASSHPEVAALVWGGVKFTILAANNVSSYFDKLSTLFMNLGRTCPRFRDFELLYPSSPRLQRLLCDYYAVVVRLCSHSVQVLRKPVYTWFTKALVSPFEVEFGPFQKELDTLSQEIREEISLASKQAQKQEIEFQGKERQEAGAARTTLAKLSRRIQQRERDAEHWQLEFNRRKLEKNKWKALDALSLYDYQKTYRRIRRECLPGTSTWICQTDEFQAWMIDPSTTLWCIGKLGSGKSVISACVSAHIMDIMSPDDIICYFFCRFDDQESLRSGTIFRTIVRQLANNLPAEAFREFPREDNGEEKLIRFLGAKLDPTGRYFVVLDGLDECEGTQVGELTQMLQGLLLLQHLRFKIFWSSRPTVARWLPLTLHPERHIRLETTDSQERIGRDISELIKSTLIEQLDGESPELRISDPELILTIQDTLLRDAQGMFLWVKFQLQTLCDLKRDEQILAALQDLPQDLSQTFERILRKVVKADDVDIGRRIFRWVAVAKRPLTLPELQEAIATQPLQKTWEAQRLVNDMNKAVACCGNLVYIEEEERTIHFTHSSVKAFLISHAISEPLRTYRVNPEEADAEVGVICITYLNFDVFNTQMTRTAVSNLNATSIPSIVMKRSLPSSKTANKVALSLLRRHDKSSIITSRLLEESSDINEGRHQASTIQQYPFLSYGKRYWLEHTKHGFKHDSGKLWTLWCNLMTEANWQSAPTPAPWTFEDWQKAAVGVLKWIVEQDHSPLLRLTMTSDPPPLENKLLALLEIIARKGDLRLLETVLGFADPPQSILTSALRAASVGGHLNIVNRLLQGRPDIDALTAGYTDDIEMPQRTALQAAAEGGHFNVVERLLQVNADINAAAAESENRTALQPGFEGKTALQAAAGGGHISVIERLLQESADVNAASPSNRGRTALQAAAGGGHLHTFERLLREKANLNAAAFEIGGRTALQAAAEGGHLVIVEQLLEKQARVNAVPAMMEGRTALQAAAENGHLAIVERLLREKADVNAATADFRGKTAIQAAAGGGHLAIVERLLQAEAWVNTAVLRDSEGRTALQAAAEGGHLSVVDRLLQAKANVNAVGDDITALQLAINGGHLAIVERLLEEGADVNATGSKPQDKSRDTPLQLAIKGGHLAIVERLLKEGADVKDTGSKPKAKSALQLAIESGQPAVVDRLRAAGAK